VVSMALATYFFLTRPAAMEPRPSADEPFRVDLRASAQGATGYLVWRY
jgi:hypothetical protein